jgi:hypothetical protein
VCFRLVTSSLQVPKVEQTERSESRPSAVERPVLGVLRPWLVGLNERTRFAGGVAREVAGSAGGGGDRLNGLG